MRDFLGARKFLRVRADERPEEVINYYAKSEVAAWNIASAAAFLALTWSTVVLLGGYVSVLRIKDFWSLSLLSFLIASKILLDMQVTTAWDYVADIHILPLSMGQKNQLRGANPRPHWEIILLVSTWLVVKIILAICIALPIAWYGPYVALALSVTRLVQRDYGDAGGDAASKAKLNAALIIFYVLVVFQSLFVFYWGLLGVFSSGMLMLVSKQLRFEVWGPKIVEIYWSKTKDKYKKDGSLPDNWNLITFSVGLLASASPDDRLWGARVLDTFIGNGIPIRQELLSSSQAIQNLISMIIGPTRTDDDPEIRERAARIVADLSSELRITQFPDVLRCICCLLESCNQYSDPQVAHPSKNSEPTLDKTARKVLVETLEHSRHPEDTHLSLAIIEKTDHKQVVSLASGKVPKIRSCIQTLIPTFKTIKDMRDWERYVGDEYHYSYASKGTKELISQGLVILEKLTQDEDNCIEISKHQRLLSKILLPLNSQDFISNGCDHTWVEIISRSLTVVSRLISAGPTDDTTRLRHDMSRNAVAICNLMRILEIDSEGAFLELHGQAIEILIELAFDDSFSKLAFDKSTSMMEMFVKTLRRILLENRDGDAIVAKEDEEKDNTVRRKAGEALARLLHVPSARDNVDALTSATNVNAFVLLPKQGLINLLTRVDDQILSSLAKKAADVATRAQENEEQPEDRKMLAAMLSLTVAICSNNNAINGDDFTHAIPDDAAFVKKLKEIVERSMDTTTDGWRIQKLVCQVVIAMVQLKPSCTREFNGHSFKEALSKAIDTMSDVDNCMLFADDDRQVPARSLTSLVKEAQELFAQEQGDIIST